MKLPYLTHVLPLNRKIGSWIETRIDELLER